MPPLFQFARACYGAVRNLGLGDMKLIVDYVVLVVIGDLFALAVGRAVEQWSAPVSLPVFLALFFFVFWGTWRIAVRVT